MLELDVDGSAGLRATFVQDGAGFSNSESELVSCFATIQSWLRWIGDDSATFKRLAHSAPPLGPIVS